MGRILVCVYCYKEMKRKGTLLEEGLEVMRRDVRWNDVKGEVE